MNKKSIHLTNPAACDWDAAAMSALRPPLETQTPFQLNAFGCHRFSPVYSKGLMNRPVNRFGCFFTFPMISILFILITTTILIISFQMTFDLIFPREKKTTKNKKLAKLDYTELVQFDSCYFDSLNVKCT